VELFQFIAPGDFSACISSGGFNQQLKKDLNCCYSYLNSKCKLKAIGNKKKYILGENLPPQKKRKRKKITLH